MILSTILAFERRSSLGRQNRRRPVRDRRRVAEEVGRGNPGDGRTSHTGTSRCPEGSIKKSIEFTGLDGFLRKRLMRRKEFFLFLLTTIHHHIKRRLK